MTRRWLPLNALRAFESVGRLLSFTAGAQALSVSQSAVSRHVQMLEDLIGAPLFIRKPHALELTEEGAALLPTVSRSFDRIEAQLDRVMRGRSQQRRTLKVHMPPTFLRRVGLGLIRSFNAQYPEIVIDLTSSNTDGLPQGEVDIAVIFDRPHIRYTVTDLLWMIRLTPLCAPEIGAKRGDETLDEFFGQHEILHVRLPGEPRNAYWTTYCRNTGLQVDTQRGLAFETEELSSQYAMSNGGITLSDIVMLSEDIAAGRLVGMGAALMEEGHGYFLSLHAEDLADPACMAFRNWMVERCQDLVRHAESVERTCLGPTKPQLSSGRSGPIWPEP
ncbi:MAG: LysR substrate-binding domain-containing protein [Acetobacter sp.]|uniref:LysR substrate-binding domain-containing protein n=1 Tax=Acetobacter sp. TaxID=440 RepID=UPI0039E742AD